MSNLEQLRRDKILATHLNELDKKHTALLSSVEIVKSLVETNKREVSRITKLPKGDKGDPGEPGKRGVPGKDGYTPIKGKDYFDGYTPIKGKDYFTKSDKEEVLLNTLARIRQPKDGENAVVDEVKIAEKAADIIKEKGLLETKDIKGLTNEMSSYRNQLAMKQAGQHGGGDTVVAGSGVTITPLPNGTKEISAPGGAGVVQTIVAGAGISVDSTDPANPVVSAIGGGGGITRAVFSIAVPTTAGATALTDYVYFVSNTTLTLPTAVGNTNRYTVKCVSGTCVVDGDGSETIDGTATITFMAQSSVDLMSDGANFNVI